MVIGHRGGFFGPENSLKSFQGAVDNHLEGIEFDVWLSKDNEPMVLHGGKDGDLSKYGHAKEHVFHWTKKDLQSKIDLGGGERIPTLESVIEICKNSPDMLINIELKGPQATSSWSANYNYDLAAQKIIELIDKHEIANKTMVSSFVPRIINTVVKYSEAPLAGHPRRFVISPLSRGKEHPEDDTLRQPSVGINISVE